MNRNQSTTCMDLNEKNMDFSEDVESTDLLNTLNSAYAQLGKAFYEYRFEEPTPELLLYFDQITQILKTLNNFHQEKEYREPKTIKDLSKNDDLTNNTFPFSQVLAESSSTRANSFSEFSNPSIREKSKNTVQSQPKTFIMFDSSPSSKTKNSKKKSCSSSTYNKEKDRISSLEDLPNLEKKNTNFISISQSASYRSLLCPICGSPISLEDTYCVNCGNRVN